MSSISKKEAQKKLKEEKKRIKEEQKQRKREETSRKKNGATKPIVGQVIGAPTNFSHDTHVGWDTEHGFELRNIPLEWKKLFKDAGVTRSELEDPETRRILVDAVRQSMYGGAPLSIPAPPPPPPAPAPPPPPPSGPGGGGSALNRSGGMGSPRPRDPFAIGCKVKAIWSGDGQSYNAVIDAVREEGGSKIFTVTFTEYGNQEDVGQEGITPLGAGGAPMSDKEQAGLAQLLKLQADTLKPPDLTDMTQSQEETIVDHLQKALAARRNGFVSVYGADTVTGVDQAEWENDDDSWMDF